MLAVRIHGKGDIRVEEVEAPHVAPGKVLLGGGYTGICGSDLHLYYAPQAFPWDFSRPAKLTGAVWPQILGHEFSGEVTAVGEGVESIRPGDRVAVFPYHYCGECPACRADRYTSCPFVSFEGIQGRSGGMAQVKVVDADQCFVLPEAVDLRLGALVEPMAVAWHGVAMSAPDERAAVVVGGGPIGVGAYFALKAKGVETVVVSEPSAERRAILAALGVRHIVDPVSEDLADRVRELTGGAGAAAAIDCAGVPQALPDALRSLGLGGRLVIVAAYEKTVELDTKLLFGDRSIRTSAVYTREDFAAVITAMATGLYRTDGGWVDTIDFQGVEAALQSLRAGKGMKLLVETP
ncbi:zinc-binding dehydrogenase [Streptomyces fuscichromogenes]|uniref:zinc-binding dehydrogenase n=1 Tax=Streptomyces fuscichromogenes TaxID=1324013 RepID=UPI003813A8DE